MTEKKPTSVTPWEPFDELQLGARWPAFSEPTPARIRQLLQNLGGFHRVGSQPFSPALDIAENDVSYVVTVELPGIGKEDVSVECRDNQLTIRGEKTSERKEKTEHARYIEREYGAFRRSFTLPDDADGDRVSASFKEGVLTIEISRTEESKPRTVVIG